MSFAAAVYVSVCGGGGGGTKCTIYFIPLTSTQFTSNQFFVSTAICKGIR